MISSPPQTNFPGGRKVALAELSGDPDLANRGELQISTIVSFASSSIGLISAIAKFVFIVYPFVRTPSLASIRDIAVAHSVFAPPSSSGWKISILSLIQLLFDDLVQIIVVCQTVRFTGIQSTLFILPISILSLSINLGETLAVFVFGKKIQRGAKFGLQFVYTAMIYAWVLVVVVVTLNDTFCDLDRTAASSIIFSQLGECPVLGGNIAINANEVDVRQFFVAGDMAGEWNITDNGGNVDLVFGNIEDLTSEIAIQNNTGNISLGFPLLDTLSKKGSLVFANNENSLGIFLPLLFEIETGGSLIVSGNGDNGNFSLPSLTIVAGTLALQGNSFTSIDLNPVQNVDGMLLIEGGGVSSLNFNSLYLLTGQMSISRTTQLQKIVFPSLSAFPGRLTIEGNRVLEVLSFPQITSTDMNLLVSDNPQLRELRMDRFGFVTGMVIIANNPSLPAMSWPRVFSMSLGSRITISSNSALLSLDVRGLQCGWLFSIVLSNNANLRNVTIPSVACQQQIANDSNPQMKFICLDGTC